jgi:hypothetical protein
VAGLPCPRDGCHLNLLARAHHPRARRGNLLVIGGDEASGRIVQDKGRVNVVRLRRDAVASVTRHVRGSSPHRRVPVRSGDRRVVRSVPLPGLEKGEHFEVRGAFVAALGRLPYNALISSHMVVAPSRIATHPRDAARVISLRGKLSEVNGYNCTHGPSAHRTPCVTRKAGVATVKRDPRKVLGPDPDLYVNLVARSQPKLARARQGHRVRVRAGRMVVTRYGPPRG